LPDSARKITRLAVEIAGLPDKIRGYGHVKARNLAAVRPDWGTACSSSGAAAATQRQAA
jgi:indolepyruvate ferredoxin oxidoreductase